MIPFIQGRQFGFVRSGVNRGLNFYQGVNAGRQSRFEARSARRWGDLALLELSAPYLWLENGCVPTLEEPAACAVAPIIDLWP
jgi:hypothetical protein